MLVKPDACVGCPLYQDGHGFVPDEMIEGAAVLVLGQNPGADEAREGRPFVGRTGEEMMRVYFPAAGLRRGITVSVANAIRCRWTHSNVLPPERVLKPALAWCMREHYRPPVSTRLVVASGALAWRALGGPPPITDWRGFLKP